jgi:translation initiation factor IF-3
LGKTNLFWRTNYQIRASRLRVIGSDSKLIGEMNRDEAIKKAQEEGLTLVEIAPNANPAVAKIVDFGKFKYSEEKKARASAKGVKGGEVKEIRFSPFIGEADFKVRIERIKEFFAEKNKVRVVVVFTGPQMRVKNIGFDIITRVKSALGDSVIIDMEPKFLGKHLVTVISQTNKGVKKNEQTENKEVPDKQA